MTRKEAIMELEEDKALYMPKEWIESLDRDTPDGRLITALDMAIKALEQTTWIPITERLPEEGEVVLTQAIFKDDIKLLVSSRVDYNYWTGWGTRDINIVAWMPLPSPYLPDINVGKMAESEVEENV